jgi:hypothetical protein
VFSYVANADIYFDNSLLRLGDLRSLDLGNTILALSKWTYINDDLSLQLRTNTQDAWIFKAPLNFEAVVNSNFHMGKARCDNRLAYVLAECGYTLINPAFAIHAIELQTTSREGKLYSVNGSVPGAVRELLLSDRFQFTDLTRIR